MPVQALCRAGLCSPSPRRRPGSRRGRLGPGLRRGDGVGCSNSRLESRQWVTPGIRHRIYEMVYFGTTSPALP